MQGKLIVLSGPGGVGKSTIVEEIRKRKDFYFSVSVTTREPRAGETDGVSYHYVDNAKFDELIAKNSFLEWAEFAGNRYGTLREPVETALSNGLNVLLEIEIAGARQIRLNDPKAILVFLEPPSFAILEERIRGRGTDSEERIQARLALAREEMAASGEFDLVVVNHRVEQAVNALVSLAAH